MTEKDGYELPTLEAVALELASQIMHHKNNPRSKLSPAIQSSPTNLKNYEPYVSLDMHSDSYHSFGFHCYLSWKGEKLELLVSSATGSLGTYCKGYAEGFVECFNAVPPDRMIDALKKLEAKRATVDPD
jgi:hypothetical protein